MDIEEILQEIETHKLPLIEITGGEPLMQENVYPLMDTQMKKGKKRGSKGRKSEGMKRFREGDPPVRGFPTYMVVKQGASNPVNHISLTITILSSSDGSLNRFSKSFFCCFDV